MRKLILLQSLLVSILFSGLYSQDMGHPRPTSDVYNGARGTSFNQGWKFYHGDVAGANAVSFDDNSWRALNLPHDFSIENSFNPSSPSTSEGGFLDGGIGWYRKTFTLPTAYQNKRISITFDGSYMNTEVWVNGNYLGIRPYGFITFTYDLTQYLNFGSTANVIAVKVNNRQKSCRWYSGSGIYRNVWLTITDPVNITFCGSKVTTPIVSSSSASVEISTNVQNQSSESKSVSLLSVISDRTGAIVASTTTNNQSVTAGDTLNFVSNLTVNNPNLWSIDSPYLYHLKTYVISNATKIDSFASTIGFRTAVFNAASGFVLNGKSVKIHGVCLHQDLGSLGSAQNYRALERQIEIMKSMGVNGIRTSHNPPAPELLEICDRLGLVVMDEVFDIWTVTKGDVKYGYNLAYNTWMPQDVKDWVIRDRNHPSVVLWSAGNEIPQMDASGATCLTNIIAEIKKYDTTRPVTLGMNNWGYAGVYNQLDVAGFNYASGGGYDSYHAAHPNQPIIGSETSSAVRTRSVYHTPTTNNLLTNSDMQCSSYDNSVVGWGHSAENSWKYDRDRAFVAGQFIWTGFDYIGEPTPYNHTFPSRSSYFGIVDLCGFPKDIYYFYKSQWTTAPMVHLLPHWNWTIGSTIPVWTYSNCDSVRLIVNGVSLGAKTISPTGNLHQEWKVPFVSGKVKALGFVKGVVVAMDSVVTAGSPLKIETLTDRDSIHADGLDLAFIETNILDENGNFCVNSDTLVNFSIIGPGKIIGVDNGNPLSIESFKGTSRKTFKGKCLAIVQSTGQPGQIIVTATSPVYQKNIALNKTVTADSQGGTQLINVLFGKSITADSEQSPNMASNAIDGSDGTRWCANDASTGHYIVIDMGSNFNLIGGRIMWEKAATYKYKIETSTDNTNWTMAVDRTASNPDMSKTQLVTFNATARYVKLTVTGLQSGLWASLYEFSLFDGSKKKGNIAQGTVITTDSEESTKSNYAVNAVDGDPSTRWCANDGSAGHWLKLDLGSVKKLIGSEILWEKSGVAYKYKIEVSTDNSTWTTAVNQTSGTRNSQLMADDLSVSARYVKVTVTGGVSSGTYASISEFRLFDGSLDKSGSIYNSQSACDNDYSTCWQASDGDVNHSLILNLGSNTRVTGSEIFWVSSGTPFQYKIESSIDSLTWSVVVDKMNNTSSSQKQSDSFVATARYLKVTITGGTSILNPANIIEFRVFDGSTATMIPSSVTINALQSPPVVSKVSSVFNNPGISIYPNPVNDILNVQLTDQVVSSDKFEVFDMMGKKVLSSPISGEKNKINTSALANGLYFLKYKTSAGKFIVLR